MCQRVSQTTNKVCLILNWYLLAEPCSADTKLKRHFGHVFGWSATFEESGKLTLPINNQGHGWFKMAQLCGQKTHPATHALSSQSLGIRALWVICGAEWIGMGTFTKVLALKNPQVLRHDCGLIVSPGTINKDKKRGKKKSCLYLWWFACCLSKSACKFK